MEDTDLILKDMLDKWDGYLLSAYRRNDANLNVFKVVDNMIQSEAYAKLWLTIENDGKERTECHLLINSKGVRCCFNGVKLTMDSPVGNFFI